MLGVQPWNQFSDGAGGGRGEVRQAPRGQGKDLGLRQPIRHPVVLTPYMHARCIIVLWLHAFICKVVIISATYGIKKKKKK